MGMGMGVMRSVEVGCVMDDEEKNEREEKKERKGVEVREAVRDEKTHNQRRTFLVTNNRFLSKNCLSKPSHESLCRFVRHL